jgi:DNA (cytosine-5)-methyltransferase 1
MLEPGELAAAMSFNDAEKDYEFKGNKAEKTKQIGNAVLCGIAAALVGGILETR